jgi:hypothetical protein
VPWPADVLDVAGEQVAVERKPVDERRSVIEDILRRALATCDAGAERIVGRPVVEHLPLKRREIRGTAALVGAHVGPRIGGLAHGCFSPVPGWHGDDDAPVRERRGTTPLATVAWPLLIGCDGPARSVLLGRSRCSSEGSPMTAGSNAVAAILTAEERCRPRGPPESVIQQSNRGFLRLRQVRRLGYR